MDVYRRLLAAVSGVEGAELDALGAQVGDGLAATYPDLLDELEGMAQGAGQPVETLLAINARTELLGGDRPGECTVIGEAGEAGEGQATITQTWDWHPDLARSRVLWTVVQPSGGWHVTLTEAGILAKLGMSGQGVACGLNFLTCSADGGVGGTPIHVLLRVVLDRCDSLTEALGTLTGARVTASSCVTLAGAEPEDGLVAAVELSPGGAEVVLPDASGRLVHANHFLRAPRRGVDTQPRDQPSSLLRQHVVERRLGRGAEPFVALQSHAPGAESVCRHVEAGIPWPDRRATLATVELAPGIPSLRLGDGSPCERPLEPVALP